jgi:hypothetical protein
MLKRCVLVAALIGVLAPASARADWLFTPNIGSTFGGAADGRETLTYGASIGWMGAGIFGFEADLQYSPEFFEGRDGDIDLFGNANVLTFMGNAIFGVPVGGQRGPGIRPFGLVGVGLLTRQQDSADQIFDIDSNEFGFTSESVSEGHPDKVCDYISDSVLDACFEQDPQSRVACETLVKNDHVVLAGEITTNAKLDYERIVRQAVKEIGYTDTVSHSATRR